MAASQFQKQQEREKKEGARVVDDSLQVEDVSKEGIQSDSTVSSSVMNSSVTGKATNHSYNQSQSADQSPLFYPSTASYGFYYPGFSGSVGELYNQGYYIAGSPVDPQFPVMQADAASFVYMPGLYSGYDTYTPYVPVSTVSADGQFAGQQVFSPSPVFQSPVPSPDLSVAFPHGDPPTTYLWGSSLLAGDVAFGNGYVGVLEIPPAKPISSNPVGSGAQHSKSSKVSNSTTNLSLDVLSGHNKKQKAHNKASSHVSSFQADFPAQGYYAVTNFPMYNQGKSGFLYSNNTVNSKTNVKGWSGSEKSRTRSKVNGVDEVTVVKEKNQGPITTYAKDTALVSGGKAPDSSAADEVGNITSPICRDQYNLPEFSTKYDHASFFVIKSYSEDDIHKSIKYNVWASTPNGNKRLNSAYEDAQVKMAELGSKCPVFLFFSVNASGQFCGVAEMIDRVDFSKSMDFWQQSKWNGYFPVKWHIIKDIPNAQLRHIILENNENKPVTNSRDTQEVKFDQGIEMLSIFKSFTSNTSILDDFDFYENRQKIMQEKRLRQSVNHHDLQLKVDQLTSSFQSVDLSTAKNT